MHVLPQVYVPTVVVNTTVVVATDVLVGTISKELLQSIFTQNFSIVSAIKRAQCTDTNKYTSRHEINVPAGNGQAGKAPDSRVRVMIDKRNFYYYNL